VSLPQHLQKKTENNAYMRNQRYEKELSSLCFVKSSVPSIQQKKIQSKQVSSFVRFFTTEAPRVLFFSQEIADIIEEDDGAILKSKRITTQFLSIFSKL